jgi:hypothetical protein
MAGNRNVTIQNNSGQGTFASPDPAPISKGGGNNQTTQVTFNVTTGDNNTYTLTGLNGPLTAPASVDISSSSSAGPYSVNPNVNPAVNGTSFNYGIAIKTVEPYEVGDGSAQIMVDP